MAGDGTKGKKRKTDNSYDETDHQDDEKKVIVSKVDYDKSLSFKSIGGLNEIKKTLILSIVKDFVDPDRNKKKSAPRGVGLLFHGPPGTGKTFMALCLISELNRLRPDIPLYCLNGGLKSKYFGESEQVVKNTFEVAKKTAPSVILIDEMENIGSSRDTNREEANSSIVSQLLVEIQNLKNNDGKVLVIGTTNLLHKIDPALIRSGRVDTLIQFLPPNETGRLEVLKKLTATWNQQDQKPNNVLLDHIAKETKGFTGADLEKLTRNIVNYARSRLLDGIDINDVGTAISKLKSQKCAITAVDWISETIKMKPTSSSSFGSCLYAPDPVLPLCPKLASALFENVENEVLQGLPAEKAISNGKIIKPILVWGTESLIGEINNVILPTVMSKLMNQFVLYTVNYQLILSGEKSESEVILDALRQSISCEKPAIIYLPSLDAMFLDIRQNEKRYLQSVFQRAQKYQVVVLATTTSPPEGLECPVLQELFQISKCVQVEGFSAQNITDAFKDTFQRSLAKLGTLNFAKGLSKAQASANLKLQLSQLAIAVSAMTIRNILELQSEIETLVSDCSEDAEEFIVSFEELIDRNI